MLEQSQDKGSSPVRAHAAHGQPFRALAAIAGVLAVLATSSAQAQRPDAGSWIDTWSASPQPVWEPDFFVPVGIPRSLRNQTCGYAMYSSTVRFGKYAASSPTTTTSTAR